MRINIGLINLGCPKNLVDAETLLGFLDQNKFYITDMSKAEIAIVNTCCFIKKATEESLETIFELNHLKRSGKIKLILVTGCIPQRYKKEIFAELKEADAFIGPGKYNEINNIIENCLNAKREFKVSDHPAYNIQPRRLVSLTPEHYRYLKISDGCSNKCYYCSIPSIRGPYRSTPWKDLKIELESLSKNKRIKELNIIGQDITAYGNDLKNSINISYLLKNIIKETSIPWIRLLYTHPKHFEDELLELISSEKRICRYIDLPLQHISDRILTKMNRGVTNRSVSDLLDKIRKITPRIAVRTTFIVGFPSETDKDFNELMDFVKVQNFDRLGAFKYSPEEGTKAFSFMPRVPKSIQEERYHELMSAQKTLSANKNKKLLGQNIKVLIEDISAKKNFSFSGRTESDAPEIDNTVWIKKIPVDPPLIIGERGKFKKNIKPGNFCTVKITQAKPYDLTGEIVSG